MMESMIIIIIIVIICNIRKNSNIINYSNTSHNKYLITNSNDSNHIFYHSTDILFIPSYPFDLAAQEVCELTEEWMKVSEAWPICFLGVGWDIMGFDGDLMGFGGALMVI